MPCLLVIIGGVIAYVAVSILFGLLLGRLFAVSDDE